jgi:hypothetical protein
VNSGVALSLGLIGALSVANFVVSVAVARSHYYSSRQKVVQVLLVWALPLLGAVAVGVFLYSQRDNEMFDTRAYPEPSEKAVGYTIHESIQGRDHAP